MANAPCGGSIFGKMFPKRPWLENLPSSGRVEIEQWRERVLLLKKDMKAPKCSSRNKFVASFIRPGSDSPPHARCPDISPPAPVFLAGGACEYRPSAYR